MQIRGYNDGGWFTLYPNFGETASAGLPYFFQVLSYVSTAPSVLYNSPFLKGTSTGLCFNAYIVLKIDWLGRLPFMVESPFADNCLKKHYCPVGSLMLFG